MVDSTWIKNLPTPIAVVGLGKSGTSALRLLMAVGIQQSCLLTYDERDAAAEYKDSVALLNKKPKTLVVSPGVPLSTPWIQSLVQSGVVITSEISIAASLLTSEKIIGITGSVGKSTVVSILGKGAKSEDDNCFVGGNLGIPFCEYALGLLNGKPVAQWLVVELSSYQLENCAGLHLDFSAITFLSPNHLERYENLQQYYQTKIKITSMTKNICVINGSSSDAVQYSLQGFCPIVAVRARNDMNQELRQSIQLIGEHNHDNFAVAYKLAQLVGWSEKSIEAMAQFKGLPHRLENVGTFQGIQFINDSKATAMDSVLVATKGCYSVLKPGHFVHLLLGGKDKNLPWEDLQALSHLIFIRFVFFGACRDVAKNKSGLQGSSFETLTAAIESCFQNAKAEDIVLLSPGGTSLDEFKNFEQRGEFFKTKVLEYYK